MATTINDLRTFYREVEQTFGKPSQKTTRDTQEYVTRTREIHSAIRGALNMADGEIVDDLPPETEIPEEVEGKVSDMREWFAQRLKTNSY